MQIDLILKTKGRKQDSFFFFHYLPPSQIYKCNFINVKIVNYFAIISRKILMLMK